MCSIVSGTIKPEQKLHFKFQERFLLLVHCEVNKVTQPSIENSVQYCHQVILFEQKRI